MRRFSLLKSPSPHLAVSGLTLAGMMSFSCTPSQSADPDTQTQETHVTTHASLRFDFGTATHEANYKVVDATSLFSAQRGYGWLDTKDLATRDRQKTDDLRRDFVMGKGPATFRVTGLAPGRYLLTAVCGDTDYGDHATRITIAGDATALPVIGPLINEFVTLKATVNTQGTLDITFDSPQNNWVVNALSLERTTLDQAPSLTRQYAPRQPAVSTWRKEVFATDPTKPLLDAFRAASQGNAPLNFRSTGLNRADYLKLITSEVDFWKGHQDANGAITDPYKKVEWQYSTPAFANAASLLVARANRADLIEPAAKALDWATQGLADRKAATGHEDFYPSMIAHAMILLKPQVKPERAATWEANMRRFDPYVTYRAPLGSQNWNIVSSSGEVMLQQMGLRDRTNGYVTDSFAAQGHLFTSPYGVYLEGPMAYDHFPRFFLADVLAQGYSGPYSQELTETLRRAAITSLFMQSPWGELPAGGRSAHHQWNEAEQCVTYEIYAAQAQKAGDAQMAGIYKRAAHLALFSMRRWVRPSGEMQIIKNWVEPAQRHAYEGYSAHSQYNLLPMSMLAIAYDYAAPTETVAERPAPADVGGFAFEVPQLHKVFANAGGTYVELDTRADAHYDATGLIRVQEKGISPQLGPSDSLMAHSAYASPNPVPMTTGVGVAWQGTNGTWHTLGEMDGTKIKTVQVKPLAQSATRVAFDVTYEGDLSGATRVIEHYVLTPTSVELSTEVGGNNGPLRYMWPVLADDGKVKSEITVNDKTVSVSQDGGRTAQAFTARNAASMRVEAPLYSNHNGWARMGVAEFPQGGTVTLLIAPKTT